MITLSTSSINFGKLTVGKFKVTSSSNPPFPVTVFNSNSFDVNITISSNNSVFTPLDTAILIPAGGSAVVNVKFEPDIETTFNGILTIDNDAVPTQPANTVNLAGVGVKGVINSDLTSLDFGFTAIEDEQEIEVEIINESSDAVLTISDITSDNSVFSSNINSFSINPSNTKKIKIKFLPVVEGEQSGIITIINDSSNNTSYEIPVIGIAQQPIGVIDKTVLDFGKVTLNDNKILSVILSNNSVEDIPILVTDVSVTNSFFRETINTFRLEAGFALEIPVTFLPQNTLVQNAQLIITTNAGIFQVNIAGQGLAAPNINVPTKSINFGSSAIGEAITKTLRISNFGVIDLSISSIFSNNQHFLTSPNNAIIAPNAVLDIQIEYTPTVPEDNLGILTILSNDPDQSQETVSLSGKGITPVISSEDRLNFDNVAIETIKPQIFVIDNIGDVPLIISGVTFNNSLFATTETFPKTIAARSTGQIIITFSPINVGSVSSTFIIESNDFNNPQSTIQVFGTGLAPDIAVAPSIIDYENVAVNTYSNETVRITNFGDADLNITDIQISNLLFSCDTTSLIIPASNFRNVTIKFQPTEEGFQTSDIIFVSNDPDESNITITASGTGAYPSFSTSTTPIGFGGVTLGDTKSTTIDVVNTGTVDLHISSSIPNTIFNVTPTSATITPGNVQELRITFAPDAFTSYSENLTILSDDPNNPSTQIALSGDGIIASKIELSKNSLSFGEVKLGETKIQNFQISNDGTDSLTFSITIDTNPIFLATPNQGTINIGENQTINVTFKPEGPGEVETTLTVESNDPNNAAINMTLNGTAVAGILKWESYDLKNIIPEEISNIAGQISGLLDTVQNALNILQGILDIIKAFIIDISDPIKTILEGIKTLVTNLINDLLGTGLYILPVFPGDNRQHLENTKEYAEGLKISLRNPSSLPKKIKDKYASDIQNRVLEVPADEDDKELIWGPIPDFFDSMKGGSKAFINRILESFDDAADGERPQFSENSQVGALILAADENDLGSILSLVKKMADIFKIEFKAQFQPPTNIHSIGANKEVKLSFAPNDGLLPNAFIIWKSTTQGGEPQYSEITENGKTKKIRKKTPFGRGVSRYELFDVATTREQIADAFNVELDEADNIIQNSRGYVRTLLDNLDQVFGMQFNISDFSVENDTTYFYTIQSVTLLDPTEMGSKKDIKENVRYSDELQEIITVEQNGSSTADVTEIAIAPLSVGILGIGEFSSETSAKPRLAFDTVQAGTNRCRNYRCGFDKAATPVELNVNEDNLNGTLSKTLPHKSFEIIKSSVSAKYQRLLNGSLIDFDIRRQDYKVNGNVVTFTRKGLFNSGDKIIIDYQYTEFKTASINSEKHKATASSNQAIITLRNSPIEKDSVKITEISSNLENIAQLEVLDDLRAKIKITFVGNGYNGNFDISFEYEYFKEEGDAIFRCIDKKYNKTYFDAVNCNTGQTKCEGYKNANCFYNDGTQCTNTFSSTRNIVTLQDNTKILVPEDVPFNQFWDPVYCQNGVMAQRCDGYSIVQAREGFRGKPPEWIRLSIQDLFPDLIKVLDIMQRILDNLLSGTEKLSDSIIEFIELLQRKIDSLQSTINKINNALDIIDKLFTGPGFYLLRVPFGTGGNEYLKESIKNAQDGPSSDAFGFTAGVAIVFGGPSGESLSDSLSLLF